MSNELSFAANRIRSAMAVSTHSGNLLRFVGTYAHQAIDLGYFAGIQFVEFRDELGDQLSGGHRALRMLSALEWLAANANAVGLQYPESLPNLSPKGREFWAAGFPCNAILHPHVSAIADLLERIERNQIPIAKAVPVTPEKIQDDGPCPPCTLWYGSESLELEPKPFAMISFMWGRECAQIKHVAAAMWKPHHDWTDRAFQSHIGKVNKALSELKTPFFLRRKGEFLLRG